MISRYPALSNLLADQIANHYLTWERTEALELEDCGGPGDKKVQVIFTEGEALSGPVTRKRQPKGSSSRCRALDADALRRVGSAEFAKANSLVPNVVNDGDDLSERS
jgi:hypothetical protein